MGKLKYFDATPEEFRSIFRATDSIDQKLELLGDGTDANTVAQRNALLLARDNAIKNTLGADRYQEYVKLHDPAYQDAVQTALQAGTPEVADTIYQINLAAAQELASIQANTNLTAQQMLIARKQAELEHLKATAEAMGQPVQEETPPMPTNAPPPIPPMRPPAHPYQLGVGESAATAATLYGVTIQEIQNANPNVNVRKLQPGDTILIPNR